jgi:5-methylcytosine-specific restriction endonuclease McrA
MADKIPSTSTPHNSNPRPKKQARGYGGNWPRLRLMKLRRNPACEYCHISPATCVDHVDGDTSNVAWNNLRSACDACHGRKTVQCDGGFGRRIQRAAAMPATQANNSELLIERPISDAE